MLLLFAEHQAELPDSRYSVSLSLKVRSLDEGRTDCDMLTRGSDENVVFLDVHLQFRREDKIQESTKKLGDSTTLLHGPHRVPITAEFNSEGSPLEAFE